MPSVDAGAGDRGPRPRLAPTDGRTRLSLRQLEAFCAVSMAGGMSAAAARLARTQSAVSTAIAELEATLGVALFERAGRGLRPTEAARRLLPRALEVVERAADLPAIAAGVPGHGERLRLGASRTVGPFVMPALLARFARARPGAAIELSVANTAELLARLRRLELDLAFVEGEALAPGLLLTEWATDSLCLYARSGHPIVRRFGGGSAPRASRPYVDALADARWVLREPGSGSGETFMRALVPAIGAPRVGMMVDDPLAMQRIVAASDWLGCGSRRAVADALGAGTLVELPPPGASVARALTRRFWVVRLPDRYRSDAVDALVAMATADSGPGMASAATPAAVASRPSTPGPVTPPAATPRSAPRPRSRR